LNRALSKFIVPLACLCAARLFAQDELRSWVPANPGDTWIYQSEFRDGTTGGIAHPKITRSRVEETVVRSTTVPEGTIVVRRLRTLNGKPSAGESRERAWLIHGDCLYDLERGDWNAGHPDRLSADFSKALPWEGGESVRVFCFPLSAGKTWNRESGHEWRVADITDRDPSSPDRGKTFHVSSYIGSGLTEDVWFEKFVGIIKETAVHEETYEETRDQLLLFEPAPSVAIGEVPAPIGEFGLHYSNNSLSTSTTGESNQNGASAYGQYFFKGAGPRWSSRALLGIAADLSGSASGSGSLYTYLFGPRFNVEWRRTHLVYFFEPVIGGAHVGVNGTTLAGSAATATRSSFAWGFSSGFGVLAGPHCVVTLYQGDFDSLEVPDSRFRNQPLARRNAHLGRRRFPLRHEIARPPKLSRPN
jgi:hypothetical protein